jgi:hypothetical protein
MIADLHKRAESNDEQIRNEAKDILAKLTEKGLKTKKAFSFEKEIDIGKMAKEKAKAHVDAYNKAEEESQK